MAVPYQGLWPSQTANCNFQVKPPALILCGLCLFAFSVLFSVTAVEAGLFFVLAVLIFEKYRDNDLAFFGRGLKSNPLFIPWMVYLAVCLLTGFLALNPAKGVGYFPSDLIKYICFSTLCLALKPENTSTVSGFYIFGAVISAAYGVWQAFWCYIISGDFHVRAGAFSNPVRYGEIMVIAFTLVLSRILITPSDENRWKKALYAVALIIIPPAIAFSQTRGAYLGLITAVAGILVFEKQARKKLFYWLLPFAAAGAVLILLNPAVRYRMTSIADGAQKAAVSFTAGKADEIGRTTDTTLIATNVRIELWKIGFRIFKDHPVFGVGPANVKGVFKAYHPGRLGDLETYGSLHNLYIHHLAERGVIGLLALLFLFGSMFVFAFKRFKTARNSCTLWALAVLPAYFVMNITEISFQHIHTSFAVFLALAAGFTSGPPIEPRDE